MKKGIYVIGEVGQAHDGSIMMAHSYIDALAHAGVDAVKFQMHIADAESSIYEDFRIQMPYEHGSRMDYWRRMEFTASQWAGLKSHCDKSGLDFVVSPFSIAAVDLLETVGVSAFKIGSGEVNNLLMLDRIASTGKEIILSSGMSSWEELDEAVTFLQARNVRFSILQCTSAYPTQPCQWGLNVIQELKKRYEVPVGFSDHSGDLFACLAATSLGATALEFHVIFNKHIQTVDTQSSLTIEQARTLVTGIRQIETALKSPTDKNDNTPFISAKSIFEKTLAVNKQMQKGRQIRIEDLETKKPSSCGIASKHYQQIVGKTLSRDIGQGEFLTETDLVHA